MQGMGRKVCERAAICRPRICANAPRNAPRTTDRTGRYELIRSRAGRRKQLLPLYEKSSVVVVAVTHQARDVDSQSNSTDSLCITEACLLVVVEEEGASWKLHYRLSGCSQQ
jgi:hypothetical protein